jgi:hypothetical protein
MSYLAPVLPQMAEKAGNSWHLFADWNAVATPLLGTVIEAMNHWRCDSILKLSRSSSI